MLNRLLIGAFFMLSGPAVAQTLLAEYETQLGAADRFNSSGVQLLDFCEIVRQDRANFHHFQRRDPGDGDDPVFSSAEARARIPGRCVVTPGHEYLPRAVVEMGAQEAWFVIRVRVYGRGGMPDRLEISERAG